MIYKTGSSAKSLNKSSQNISHLIFIFIKILVVFSSIKIFIILFI